MEDSNRTHQSTYQYKKPFRFMGAEYTDSRSLAEAFIDNWDIAASVFRRGSMEGFWEEYVREADGQSIDLSAADAFFHKAYGQMWDCDRFYNYGDIEVDAIFQVILHYIEPALNGIPFVRAENNEAKVYSIEELGDWLLSLSAGDEWIDRGDGWIENEFDADKWNRTFVLDAAEHKVFSAYVPETEEAEKKFCTAPDDQKCRFLGELALKLQGKEGFWYHNVFYTSMEELGPVMKEQLSKGVDIQLFRDLFDSDEYSASFDSWIAKVDGGKYQEKLSELKKSWHKLKEKLPHDDRIQMTIEYSTCDSFLDQFPLNNTEIESFLAQKHSAALEKVISIQEECIYNLAIANVVMGIVNVGFMQKEDIEQILLLEYYITAEAKLKIFEPYLENEKAYKDELERAIAYFDEKQLTPAWNEANREGKILLLALGWHQLPAGEPNQAEALLQKINESWQKDKDPSILIDAGKVLLSVLQKGLSGGWDRTSAEGASAYEQCLELIDRISGLCIGVDSAELAEKWNKICEIINAKSLEPYEQAFFEFSEKYQKDEDTVIRIVKKSGYFGGISHDGEKRVTIKLTETAGGEKFYPKSVSTMIRQGCQTASDYLSDYRQQIEKLDRELSAIREAGCHYGKIREDLEEHKRFMADLKDAEDHLKKSFADADPLMEEAERRMLETDRINKEIEEKQKKEREAKRKEEKEKERLRIEAETQKKIKKAKRRAFFRKHRKSLTVLAVLAVVSVLFYLRYASPTYYGTKFYPGNRINYPEYKIAGSVKRIYPDTFTGADKMTHIEIPESVTSIGNGAFRGCTSLKEIVIPENVTEIGWSAFEGCTSLESVELRSGTISLGSTLFRDCGSLKEIKNEGNITDLEELLKSESRVSNCCNLDMSEVYDDLYYKAIEGVPLLENEVQLKNLLDRREMPYGEEAAEEFDPMRDILADAAFGEEKKDDHGRSVDFSYKLKRRGVTYLFEGTASSESESSEIHVELNCTDIDLSELLQQLRAGDKNAILEMLDGQTISPNGYGVILHKEDEITIEESELIEESTEKYRIPLKLKINKPLGEITCLGSILLSEQNRFFPEMIYSKAAMAEEIDLLGSYTFLREDGTESILTIDKQYEKCYSVTENGKKRILIMDIAAGGDGKYIEMRGENYFICSAGLNAGMDGIWISGLKYYKTGSAVSNTVPEDITPFAGVWQGTYQGNGKTVTVNSRRYILPVEENVLAVVSDFGPMEGANDFASGTTLGILNYDPQSGSCVIESKEWLEQPEGYRFVTFEGKVNDSYDVISGDGGECLFIMTKTEPDNTTGMAADTGDWSIYDESGNVREKLASDNENIPEDALTWNDSSYYIFNGFETWEEAEAYCESLGGHLAVIESAEENEAVYSYVREQGYSNAFFGASDAVEEGEWRWVDGSAMSYTNWHKNEPNNDKNEDYIDYYYKDGTWNDSSFKSDSNIICEWD